MATHSSVLAWRIPGLGEPGGLLSMGLLRVGHDWSDLAAAAAEALLLAYFQLFSNLTCFFVPPNIFKTRPCLRYHHPLLLVLPPLSPLLSSPPSVSCCCIYHNLIYPFCHCVLSSSRQLWRMLSVNVHAFWWTCGCLVLGTQLGVEMLGHKVCMPLILVVITSFLKWLGQLTFPSTGFECSCSIPSSTRDVVSLKIFSYSGIRIVVFQCSFNLCNSGGSRLSIFFPYFGPLWYCLLWENLFIFSELSVLFILWI